MSFSISHHHNHRELVTVAPNPPPPPPGLKPEYLTHSDVSKLSQSELYRPSICSDSAFDLRRTDDLVILAVDCSVFKESAGTRRQTYFGRRRRCLSGDGGGDHHTAENKSIVNFLKQFLNENQNSTQLPKQAELQFVVYGDRDNQVQKRGIVPIEANYSEGKRKRGRKPRVRGEEEEEVRAEIELEIVNTNGVVVNLGELVNANEIYSGELRRRSVNGGGEN